MVPPEENEAGAEEKTGQEDPIARLEATFNERLSSLEQQLTEAVQARVEGKPEGEGSAEERTMEEELLEIFDSTSGSAEEAETMSDEERGEAQKKATQKGIATSHARLKSEIDTLRQELKAGAAVLTLRLTESKHADMNLSDEGYRKRFIGMAQENPTWDPEKIYQELRKTDRIKELDEKEVESKRRSEELQTLTEKGGAPSGSTERGSMSSVEAATKAHAIAFGTKEE